MYKYMYVEASSKNMLSESDHRELIDKYSSEGWRFISALPTRFENTHGSPKKFDLVFEKRID